MTSSTALLFDCAAIRRIEAAWLRDTAPGELMAAAGAAVADEAVRRLRALPPATGVLLLVGPGNNGGDALVAGRLLRRRGFSVQAVGVDPILAAPPAATDARRAWQAWHDAGCRLLAIADAAALIDAPLPPLVVDGLFGIGLTRPLAPDLVPLIEAIRRRRACVVAIDVPSGLDADTGSPIGGDQAVGPIPATATVTMIADKPGLHTGSGATVSGSVQVARLRDLPLPEAPAAVRLVAANIAPLLPVRSRDAHKGSAGDVLIVGGRLGMGGAARLAARGALAAGAGRVWIADGLPRTGSRGEPAGAPAAPIDPVRPEIMRFTMPDGTRSPRRAAGRQPPGLERFGAIVVGCGLGQDPVAVRLLAQVFAGGSAVVCDADALTLLAQAPDRYPRRAGATILTPHPLEAARLLGTTTPAVQADRIGAAIAIAKRYRAVVVLKGPGTVVADAAGHYAINASGHPVLATGGTGDVLGGMIGALAAAWQAAAAPRGGAPRPAGAATTPIPPIPPITAIAALAACAGVWLHGAAGERLAASIGPAGVPAGRLCEMLPVVLGSLAQRNGI